MVICDDDFKVLFEGYTIKEKKKESWSVFSFPFTFKKDNYFVVGKKWYSKYEYWEYFLWYFVLDTFCDYMQRRKWGEYYYLTPYVYQFEKNIWIVAPLFDRAQLDEKFFEATKHYLITLLQNGYYKSKFFLNTYFYEVPLSRREAITVLQKSTWSQFQTHCIEKLSVS
jgi:hypothetical protein